AWPPEEIPRQYRPPAGHSLRGADLRLDSPPQIPHPLRHSPWWDGLSEGADALDRTAPRCVQECARDHALLRVQRGSGEGRMLPMSLRLPELLRHARDVARPRGGDPLQSGAARG